MGMTQRNPTGRRRTIRITALILVVLVVVGLFGWWHYASAPFPVKHQRGDSIVAQTKALFDSNPDLAQAALDRSGRKDITLDIQRDPGIYKITEIQVNRGGQTYLFDRPSGCGGAKPAMSGDCVVVLIGPHGFDITNVDDIFAAVYLNKNDTVLSSDTVHDAVIHLHEHKQQIELKSRKLVTGVLDTLASHWLEDSDNEGRALSNPGNMLLYDLSGLKDKNRFHVQDATEDASRQFWNLKDAG